MSSNKLLTKKIAKQHIEDGLPSKNVLSAKEAANLRKLIETKTLSKIRFVCETLDNLDATGADYAKLFPKTRIKELVKHANDEQNLEILDTLAEALEKYPELFEQLQKECVNFVTSF